MGSRLVHCIWRFCECAAPTSRGSCQQPYTRASQGYGTGLLLSTPKRNRIWRLCSPMPRNITSTKIPTFTRRRRLRAPCNCRYWSLAVYLRRVPRACRVSTFQNPRPVTPFHTRNHTPGDRMNQTIDLAPSEPAFYTVAEAATKLRLSHSHIYRLLDRGLLRSTQLSEKGHHRISPASVHALVSQ